MGRYIVGRVLRGLLTIFISVSLTFFIVRAMPSNPVELLVSPQMTEEAQQAMIEAYGLDQPLAVQYVRFLGQLFQGDLGTSFSKHIPVAEYLLGRLPWTLLLLAGVMVLVIGIGVPVGVFAARRKGKTADRIISVIVTMCVSIFIPFASFLLLYFFAFLLKVMPTGGAYTPPPGQGFEYILDVAHHMVLPVIALTITNLANAVLYTRNSMIDVLKEDYIRTAYSKGNGEARVIKKHALKNALIPTVTVLGLQIGTMVGGAVVTETVFSWPGVGRLIYDAVNSLDYPVLQGAFLLLATAVVVMNILTDLVVAWLDPRIKLGGK